MPTAQSTSQVKTASAAAPLKQSGNKLLETGSNENSSEVSANVAQLAAGVKTPPEQPEFIKQALVIIEKKVRNLEKRRVNQE